MRPVELRFAGLHSYRDAQTIDFTALLGAGVFGIFGPTGSGKSTILDAITLALYGKVERAARGTQAILNHAERRLWVSFTFTLGGEAYRVERSYLRADEQTVRPGPCRLVVLGPAETVLADKSSEVTQRVQEILGLTVEDFTRAVVLPQGKFAEFLQLEGRERRRMLERIFALHQYGEQLNQRLKARLEETDKDLVGVEREQQGLGDASAAAVAAAAKRLQAAEAGAAAAGAALRQAEAEHQRWQRVWELQQELAAVAARLADWEGREPAVAALREELAAARRAETVRLPLADAEATVAAATGAAATLAQVEEALAAAEAAQAAAAAAAQAARQRREVEGPALAQRRDRLEQAAALAGTVAAAAARVQDLAVRITRGRELTASAQREAQELTARRERLQAEHDGVWARLQDAAVPAEWRQQVQAALVALHARDDAERALDQARATLAAREQALREATDRAATARQHEQAAAARLADHDAAAAQEQAAAEAAAAAAEAQARAEQERAAARRAAAEADRLAAERRHLAAALAAGLAPGAPCPVCGATNHPAPATGEGEEVVAAAQAALAEAEAALEATGRRWQEAQQELRRDWQARQEEARRERERLQQVATAAAAAAAEAEATRRAAAAAVEEQEAAVKEATELLAEREAVLAAARRDLSVEDVAEEAERLAARDRDAAALQQRLAQLREQLAACDRDREQKQATQQKYQEALQQRELEHAAAAQELATRREQFTALVRGAGGDAAPAAPGTSEGAPAAAPPEVAPDTPDLPAVEPLLAAVRQQLAALEQAEREAAAALETAAAQRAQQAVAAAGARKEHELAIRRREEAASVLAAALARAGFGAPTAAAAALRPPERQQELETRIQAHAQEGAQLQAEQQRLAAALGNDRLEPAAWAEQQAALAAAREQQQAAVAYLGECRREHQQVAARHQRWQELATQRRALAERLGHLRQLQQLLRGSAFVEFLAEDQMRQVALAASERLGQLTRYRYALEVDSGGGFIMRDDANGGVRRPVNTLSGGETFLTSLALALALSAQIQLRGRWPLEFFFLDEGFGTLDPELLETVLSTLERLQLERLNVGVISHVPELRHRLQRRVVVEPAEPGGRGSRLRLESA